MFLQLDGGHFRLNDSVHDPAPVHEKSVKSDGPLLADEDAGQAGLTEFAHEADLGNYLAKNLSTIQPGLKLSRRSAFMKYNNLNFINRLW